MQQDHEFRLGGVEAGGTSFSVSLCLGSDPRSVACQVSVPTTTPEETLSRVAALLLEWRVTAVGVASFGPVDLDRTSATYGYITTTPKRAWPNTDLLGVLKAKLAAGGLTGIPFEFTTDVNAAALAEMHYGGHSSDVRSCAYVTVGTGIGVGLVINGEPVTGALHPEAGHFLPRRHPDDSAYEGDCRFHKDCLEGLANAAAVAAKAGVPPSELSSVPDSHPVWAWEAHYLAQLCAQLTLFVSPHVIVLGGGVLKRECLFPLVRAEMLRLLGSYIQLDRVTKHVDTYIVPSALNDEERSTTAGAVGALHLALQAARAAGHGQDVTVAAATDAGTGMGADFTKASQ